MNNRGSLNLAGTLLVLLSVVTASIASRPQGSNQKPVIFKSPSGYMPAPLSGHTGQMFLDAGRPAGMFVGYPKDGQDMNAFTDEIKKMVVGMFLHDAKDPQWTSAPLPAHKGADSESGNLFTTGDDKMEVQLAFYSRPEGVAYGYFGMRHKKAKSDDAKFLDANGVGVKAFDELAKSIKNK
jgi:hypothetical protein